MAEPMVINARPQPCDVTPRTHTDTNIKYRTYDNPRDKSEKILLGHLGNERVANPTSLAFSPNGEIFASAFDDHDVLLYDMSGDGAREKTGLRGHRHGNNACTCTHWGPYGGWIYTPNPECPVTGHSKAVTCIAFSPNSVTLASGSADRTIKLWDVSGDTPNLRGTIEGHRRENNQCICNHNGGVSRDEYEANPACPVTGHSAIILSVAFNLDGSLLASSARRFETTVKLWDPNTMELRFNLTGHAGNVMCVAFSFDGKTLASASQDTTIKLWDLSGVNVTPFTHPPPRILEGHLNWVNSVAFSPDGKTLASASRDNTIKLWDVSGDAAREKDTLKKHWKSVRSVAFSPDNKTLVSGSNDGTIRLWDVSGDKGELKITILGGLHLVNCVTFSPDGKTIASSSEDSTRLVNTWSRIPAYQAKYLDVCLDKKERKLALCMISHARLGEGSVWYDLPLEFLESLLRVKYIEW